MLPREDSAASVAREKRERQQLKAQQHRSRVQDTKKMAANGKPPPAATPQREVVNGVALFRSAAKRVIAEHRVTNSWRRAVAHAPAVATPPKKPRRRAGSVHSLPSAPRPTRATNPRGDNLKRAKTEASLLKKGEEYDRRRSKMKRSRSGTLKAADLLAVHELRSRLGIPTEGEKKEAAEDEGTAAVTKPRLSRSRSSTIKSGDVAATAAKAVAAAAAAAAAAGAASAGDGGKRKQSNSARLAALRKGSVFQRVQAFKQQHPSKKNVWETLNAGRKQKKKRPRQSHAHHHRPHPHKKGHHHHHHKGHRHHHHRKHKTGVLPPASAALDADADDRDDNSDDSGDRHRHALAAIKREDSLQPSTPHKDSVVGLNHNAFVAAGASKKKAGCRSPAAGPAAAMARGRKTHPAAFARHLRDQRRTTTIMGGFFFGDPAENSTPCWRKPTMWCCLFVVGLMALAIYGFQMKSQPAGHSGTRGPTSSLPPSTPPTPPPTFVPSTAAVAASAPTPTLSPSASPSHAPTTLRPTRSPTTPAPTANPGKGKFTIFAVGLIAGIVLISGCICCGPPCRRRQNSAVKGNMQAVRPPDT